LLIFVSLAAFVIGQVLLKHAMEPAHAHGYRDRNFLRNLIAGTGALGIYFLLTLGLLQRFDLSFLYPFQGLSVIFISAAAALLLREELNARLIVGSLLVTLGVALVAQS
jgi:drug/metabolite transporter (DMT)-like permease